VSFASSAVVRRKRIESLRRSCRVIRPGFVEPQTTQRASNRARHWTSDTLLGDPLGITCELRVYGRPPKATRFKKGQRSNPAGRPRGRRREAPYEAVLGQMVTIREGGAPRRVTAADAFVLQLAKRGLEGDGPAGRASLAGIEERKERFSTHQGTIRTIVRIIVDPGSVTSALQPLRMARKLDPYRKTARMALEPWLVEAALARLRQPLSPADQRTIV
jgi:Family of unknown function (DUF5681)